MSPNDDEEKRNEAREHVRDREDAVNRDRRIEVGEVIDGRDEGVPWEEEPGAECEVDEVADGEVVLRRFGFGSGLRFRFRIRWGRDEEALALIRNGDGGGVFFSHCCLFRERERESDACEFILQRKKLNNERKRSKLLKGRGEKGTGREGS